VNGDDIFKEISGFRELHFRDYNANVVGWGGLNAEHLLNGLERDKHRAFFSFRKDACRLQDVSGSSATLFWPAAESQWDAEAKVSYTVHDQCVDVLFSIKFQDDPVPKGVGPDLDYFLTLFASYIRNPLDRDVYFRGTHGDTEGWIAFGSGGNPEPTENPTGGVIRCDTSSPLQFEEGAAGARDITSHSDIRFSARHPYYYGLIDGDGHTSSSGDVMVFIMMFDPAQAEQTRFAVCNWRVHPAWDWQWVIPRPRAAVEYRYRARMVYKPFVSRDDVDDEFKEWAGR